jgi:hypothetical protein
MLLALYPPGKVLRYAPGGPMTETATGSFSWLPVTFEVYVTSPTCTNEQTINQLQHLWYILGKVSSGALSIGERKRLGTPTGLKCVVGISSR